MTIILLLAGLGLIVLGADWLVDGASAIARALSMQVSSLSVACCCCFGHIPAANAALTAGKEPSCFLSSRPITAISLKNHDWHVWVLQTAASFEITDNHELAKQY